MGDLRQVVLLQDRERHGASRGDRLVKVAEVVHVASGMGALEDQTKLSGVKIRNPSGFVVMFQRVSPFVDLTIMQPRAL